MNFWFRMVVGPRSGYNQRNAALSMIINAPENLKSVTQLDKNYGL